MEMHQPVTQVLHLATPSFMDILTGHSLIADKVRVSHACEPCRQRKTKCSGERPVCRHCEEFQYSCFYADGKRERTKK